MNETQFETFIRRIRNAYGTKQLPDEVLEFLFEECGYIPQEATKWIFDRFMSENDKLPAKLHLAILRIYYDWGRGQGEPQKQISRTCPINMPDEDGPCFDGNLFVEREEDFYREFHGNPVYAFRCSDCGRETAPNVPSASIGKLLKEGWTVSKPLTRDDLPKWETRRPNPIFGDVDRVVQELKEQYARAETGP